MTVAPPIPSQHRYQKPLPSSSLRCSESLWVTDWQVLSAGTHAAEARCHQILQDNELIRRVSRGDEEAARALVDRLRPAIIKCIRRRLPRWASEEDLIQSVFAKVFSKLHQFSGTVPLECWVTRIAVNTSLNQIAYESVRPEWRMSDLTEEQAAVLQDRPDPVV